MLLCCMDPSIEQDSKCAKCCLYCDEKDTCELTCERVKAGKSEEEIARVCVDAYEA